MSQTIPQEKFYQIQSISIRKMIRELDFVCASQAMQPNTSDYYQIPHLNILVVGPRNSGKSSLLKTMNYALNGTNSPKTETIISGNTCYQKMEIKKNKKSIVKGCSSISQTDAKFGISSVEIRSIDKEILPYDRYRKACCLLQGKLMACLQEIKIPNSEGINFALICLSIVEKLSNDDMTGLRYLIVDLEQKHIPYLIVGTKIDLILGENGSIEDVSPEKLQYIEEWKKYIVGNLKTRKQQVYLIENYHTISSSNSQSINYYSLKLLQTLVKVQKESQGINQKKKSSFNFLMFSC